MTISTAAEDYRESTGRPARIDITGGDVLAMTRRIAVLDGLRGVAAIAIVLFHFNFFFVPQAGLRAMLPGLKRAYLAVDLFFLLSGFIMAYVHGAQLAARPVARGQRWQFAAARFARVYPLLLVTTACLVALHQVFGLKIEGVSFSSYSLSLQPLLLQFWGPGLSWNYPAWSIGTEAVAYVFFVVAARHLLLGRLPWLAAATCFSALAVVGASHAGLLHVYVGIPALTRTVAEFSLGVLLYRSAAAGRPLAGYRLALLAAASMMAGWLSGWDVFFVGTLGCLIHYCTTSTAPVTQLLASRVAAGLGALSYSIYLWHAPVQYAVMGTCAALGHPVPHLGPSAARALAAGTLTLIVALSALSWRYVERPLRWFVRHRLSPTSRTLPPHGAKYH